MLLWVIDTWKQLLVTSAGSSARNTTAASQQMGSNQIFIWKSPFIKDTIQNKAMSSKHAHMHAHTLSGASIGNKWNWAASGTAGSETCMVNSLYADMIKGSSVWSYIQCNPNWAATSLEQMHVYSWFTQRPQSSREFFKVSVCRKFQQFQQVLHLFVPDKSLTWSDKYHGCQHSGSCFDGLKHKAPGRRARSCLSVFLVRRCVRRQSGRVPLTPWVSPGWVLGVSFNKPIVPFRSKWEAQVHSLVPQPGCTVWKWQLRLNSNDTSGVDYVHYAL